MDLAEWLDAEPGRTTELADHCDVTVSAVSQWRTNGVPLKHILTVHEYTGRRIALRTLVERPGLGASA